MDYVYTVMVSGCAPDQREFYGTPTAYENELAAELAARGCMEAIGGPFTEIEIETQKPNVRRRWISAELSVWLERLIFEPEL